MSRVSGTDQPRLSLAAFGWVHEPRIAGGAAEGKPPALGAYGLRIDGLAGAGRWMQPVSGAPALSVEVTAAAGVAAGRTEVDGERADIRLLGGGRLRMRRGEGRASFSFASRPEDGALLHPYLAPAAALAQIWAGAEALHAGALAAPAGAVLLLGEKEVGKSTTLAWLAAERGVAVLADDLAVVVDGAVLPGPRCLDLRRSGVFDAGELAGARAVRGGERLRMPLPPVGAAMAVGAVAILRWGEAGGRVGLRAVPARERVGELLRQRMYAAMVPADLAAILDLAARPMLTLTRPPGRAGLCATGDALLRYFA